MIIRCPSCTARFDRNLLALEDEGGMVSCPSCGHDWLEGRVIEVSAEPSRATQVTIDHLGAPETEIQHLVSASLLAQETFRRRRKRRRAAAAAWLALAIFAVSPATIALAVPDRVVAAAPAAISFYDWLGWEVNIYGLEIQGVELQHLLVSGQRVIAIKGEVVNISGSERKIPWLRFGLRASDSSEVYKWQLDTESRPLRPGEAKSFITRIASPPETASSVEIRFARADEIGSNSVP
jgi:predicted Zn finger-like uncharacterized protein